MYDAKTSLCRKSQLFSLHLQRILTESCSFLSLPHSCGRTGLARWPFLGFCLENWEERKWGRKIQARWLGLGGCFLKGFEKGEVSCCLWDSGWEKKKELLKNMPVDRMPLQGVWAEMTSGCYEMQALNHEVSYRGHRNGSWRYISNTQGFFFFVFCFLAKFFSGWVKIHLLLFGFLLALIHL